jgi:hypothetical protein
MRNLNEQVKRIKSLMLIKEQCGGDLTKCAEDLKDKDYIVYSPLEIAASCDNNEVIKSVNDSLNSVSGQLITGADKKSSVDDCYVLAKGKSSPTGTSHRTWNITFYADEQVLISLKLGAKNDFKKLIFRGEFQSDGTTLDIMGGTKFKFIGVRDGSGGPTSFENGNILNGATGVEISATTTEQSSWGVTNPVNYASALNYFTNKMGIVSNKKVLQNGLNKTEIIKLIEH